MSPHISVVLPVYNGERYLVRAIESVLNQTQPVYEFIVIDDGSKDGTAEILRRYGSRLIVRNIPNGGVARAMSLGMSLATGDWVAFMDHDDVWFRTKLQRHAEMTAQFPEAGFFCSNFAVRPNGLGRRLTAHFSKLDVRKMLEKSGPFIAEPIPVLMHENIVGTSTSAVVRADIARKVSRFNDAYTISGDYDFWLQCALHAPFVVCSEMLFYKRTHEGNISADEIRMIGEHRQILKEYVRGNDFLLKQKKLKSFAAQEMAQINYRLGTLYFEHGRPHEAFQCYCGAMKSEKNLRNGVRFMSTCFKKGVRLVTGDFGRAQKGSS